MDEMGLFYKIEAINNSTEKVAKVLQSTIETLKELSIELEKLSDALDNIARFGLKIR
jgi:regulator of replication initiation timing